LLTGPITRNVKGTTTSKVKNGTKNVFTTSGTILVKNFSTFPLNKTANIIGITLELYDINITGAPKNVVCIGDSINVPLNKVYKGFAALNPDKAG